MHPRPPKSTLGRPKSRKHTMQDIEEWVIQDSMLAQEKTRHSGHPTENITEERLLKTRLMDLGKERFKVLSRLNSERQTFIDKQRRKTYMMKRTRDERKLARNKLMSDSLEPGDDKSADLPPLEVRKDIKTNAIRPKTVQFGATKHKEDSLSAPGIRPHTVALYPSDISNVLMSTDIGQFMLDMSVPVSETSMDLLDVSRPSTAVTGFSRSVSLLTGTDVSVNRTVRGRRNALKPASIVNEPRYALLEKALSENYEGHCKLDVPSIIARTESLQRHARTGGKEAKRALQAKVKQFMLEKDISFRNLIV